jgi:hypothetical protein
VSESNGDGKKVVCLGVPSAGPFLAAGTAQGIYCATSGETLDLKFQYAQGSLLALNFNLLWCWALNLARTARVDYFAMLHADVEPEVHWLDRLVAELDARGLDVLSAVVPIKDQRGITSTALAHPQGSPWRTHARLTLHEVYRLPETFTSADVGHPLLVNSGCWACRFDPAWAEKVHFEVNDRIVFSTEKQAFVPEVEPEDWFFSRLLHELGLKVGATRKVRLGHLGHLSYANVKPWGEEFDAGHLPKSVLDGGDSPDPFPRNVAGWLTEAEGRELARLAEGKDVLEVGAYCGLSTICLARGAASVTTVDPFDGRATEHPVDTFQAFTANLRRYGVDGKVTPCRGTSEEILPGLPPVFDLVFIDGAHDVESVRTDIRLARSVLRPGGLLAFHDYRVRPGEADGRWDPGVTQAVDELLGGGAELLARHDSLAVVRPPAAAGGLLKVGV